MLDVILRKTYGFQKKEDRIPTSQFQKLTGLKPQAIYKARKKLLNMNIITISQKGYSQVLNYSLQKNYTKWQLSPKKVTVSQKGERVSPKKERGITQKGEGLSPKKETTSSKETFQKKVFKETIQKKDYCHNSDEFRLSQLLFQLIRKNNPNYRKEVSTEKQFDTLFQKWAVHIDLLIRVDKRTPEQVEKVIRWSQEDDFWQDNILSTSKLRKQFNALEVKANKELGGSKTLRHNLGVLKRVQEQVEGENG